MINNNGKRKNSMSKKDNFSQAMFEMFGLGKNPEDSEEELEDLRQLEDLDAPAPAAEPTVEEPSAFAASPSAYEEDPPAAFEAPAAPAPETPVGFEASFVPAVEAPAAPVFVSAPAPAPVPAPAPAAPAHQYVRRENCTYFAPGTSMEGTLRSDSDVEICGDFKGEIASDGKVTIHANTTSSIAAAELVLIECVLTGDAMVAGDVSIDDRSSVTGNVRAANIVCSGVIKGNLNVQNNITLTENAQVFGDIKTGTLAMSRGAKVSGKVDMGG